MLQFDIVLQKQNLGPHQRVHQAMHMPSHGEFLVDALCRGGLKSGLVFGLDDFALNARALNYSQAEILLVCGADQHLTSEFQQGWQKVSRRYDYRVLIVSEPIFSPLAFYLNQRTHAALKHQRFLELFQPDCVLYLSAIDLTVSAQHFGTRFQRILYSLADPSLFEGQLKPFEDKNQALLYLGKPEAWTYTQSFVQAPSFVQGSEPSQSLARMSRKQQLAWFEAQQRVPFAWAHDKFTFRQCYQVANEFRFQLQPRSGYAFHSARAVQSAIVGCIPVILLHPDELALLSLEAPFARPDHNLLLGIEGQLDDLLDKLSNETLCRHIQQQLPELLQAGTIRQGIAELIGFIQAHFNQGIPSQL